MRKTGDNIKIKSFADLKKAGLLVKFEIDHMFHNEDTGFVIFDNAVIFGKNATIVDVDANDAQIPYLLDNGFWIPEFMIDEVKEQPKEDKEIVVEDLYICKATGKPFGKLFCKLIDIDNKVSEFSCSSFSRLKRHELIYIANILKNQKIFDGDFNKLNKDELSNLCYEAAKKL